MNLTDLNQALAEACEAIKAHRVAWREVERAKEALREAEAALEPLTVNRFSAEANLKEAVEAYVICSEAHK